MKTYILKRLLISILVIFFVTIFTCLLLHMIPGDPVLTLLGPEASTEAIEQLREELHLNDPIYKQYVLWISDIFHGDFGDAICMPGTVAQLISTRLPITISIGLPAMIISTLLGILFGVLCAVNRGNFLDHTLTLLATTCSGIPVFWVAIVGIYLFGLELQLLPIQGYTSPAEDFGGYVYKAILPVACQSIGFISVIARQTRSNMLEVINQDYIRTARADGLSENRTIYSHALRNAMIPIVTLIGLQVRLIIGGSVLLEKVFNIPGMGYLILMAVQNLDYVTVQGTVLIIATITILANLMVDLLYGLLDPRIRLARG